MSGAAWFALGLLVGAPLLLAGFLAALLWMAALVERAGEKSRD